MMNGKHSGIFVEDQQGKKYLLEGHLNGIDDLARFMNLVVNTNKLAFAFRKEIQAWMPVGYFKAPKLAMHFDYIHRYAALFSTDWVFAPELHLFFVVYGQHPIKDCPLHGPNAIAMGNCREAEVFNDFVAQLRTTAKRTDLKRQIRHWHRQSQNNLKSLNGFQAKLFDRHARLVTIRLDLYYQAARFHPDEISPLIAENKASHAQVLHDYLDSGELPEPRPIVARVSLEEVLRDKDHLFANRRGNRELFEHLVGYVWCVEFTPKIGFHLHVALMFNGAYIQHHEWLAQQIGQYWKEVVTQGRGYFYNCNRDQKKHGSRWALGAVEHGDLPKRKNLAKALAYLVKDDQRVRVKPHRKCRTFGAVIVNRNRSPRTGRPRLRHDSTPAAQAQTAYRESVPFPIDQIVGQSLAMSLQHPRAAVSPLLQNGKGLLP